MLTFNPIGYVVSSQIEPYQASIQPDELSSSAYIKLDNGFNFEQALTDLDGCSHIWVIYQFHHNNNWKPLVQTPRSNRKIGVFATRAPYRPNPIGISVVKVEKIEGLKIYIGPNDILHSSPVLDIKPYHPEYDKIDDAHINWLNDSLGTKHTITFSPIAEEQIDFLETHGKKQNLEQLRPFIIRQLQYDPTNNEKKRVEKHMGALWTLSYRTWRVDFIIQDSTVAILSIRSGYNEVDLTTEDDIYGDKSLHRRFNEIYI